MVETVYPKGFETKKDSIQTVLIVNDKESFIVANDLISSKYNIMLYDKDIINDWDVATKGFNVVAFLTNDSNGKEAKDKLSKQCKQISGEFHSVTHIKKKKKGFSFATFCEIVGNNTDEIISYIDASKKHVANYKNYKIKELAKGRKFAPIGYNGEMYYFYRKGNQTIVAVKSTKLDAKFIKTLDDIVYWEKYKFAMPEGIAKQELYPFIASELRKECESLGTYTEDEKTRSVGFWRDGDDYIYHNGDTAISKQQGKQSLFDYTLMSDDKKVYRSSAVLNLKIESEISKKESQMIEDLFKTFKWKLLEYSNVALGWTVVSPLGGLLTWRPNIWIKGVSSAGKTTIGNIIKELAMVDGRFRFEGGSTEAGIRNAINNSSFPVFIDEFESEDKKGRDRKSAIAQFIRLASSGGKIVQGINNLGGQNVFTVTNCFCMLSIGVGLDNQADLNRLSILELDKQTSEEQIKKFRQKHKEFYMACNPHNKVSSVVDTSYNDYNVLRNKFITKTFNKLDDVLEYTSLAKEELGKKSNDIRFADRLSSMVAGYAIFKNKKIRNCHEMSDFIDENFGTIINEFLEEKDIRDGSFKKILLEQEIMFPKGENKFPTVGTISELIRIYMKTTAKRRASKNRGASPLVNDWKEILIRKGIKITERGRFIINLENSFLSKQVYIDIDVLTAEVKSFAESQWKKNTNKKEYPIKSKFFKISNTVFGGVKCKTARLPIGSIIEEDDE